MNPLSRNQEHVKAVDLGLSWDPDAPSPRLVQSERRTFIAFYLRDVTPWDGSTVRMVDPSLNVADPIGVIEWLWCAGAVLGGPNDEVFHGHRLWKQGLSDVGRYAAGEVTGSRWIAELDRANRVHHNYRGGPTAMRHFILGFHDSTFECVAEGYRTWTTVASMPSVVATLGALLDSEAEPAFG